jgi:putative tricarboxylic transport membrane protein
MNTQQPSESGPSHRAVEIGVTLFIALFGLIVVIGSLQAGISWGAEGPKAGFFPFYVGLAILISSAVNLLNVLRADNPGLFAEWSQLRQVMSVVIPATIYTIAIGYIGLYISSMVFIAWFMRWLGKYSWPMVAAIAIGMPVVVYIVFERWFLVPLPKGPVEDWLQL